MTNNNKVPGHSADKAEILISLHIMHICQCVSFCLLSMQVTMKHCRNGHGGSVDW